MAVSLSSPPELRSNSRSQTVESSMQLTIGPSLNSSSPYDFTEYETKLRSVKNGALFVAGLHKLSRFFGICALTWASVVLLGGFASALRLLDFYFISILLLLEAARLSTTQVFSKLLVKTLFRERHRPEEFQFKDLQYSLASRLDLVGQAANCLLAIVSLGLAVARFGSSARHPFTENDESKTGHSNISPSLYTFYALVILNSTTAIASGFFRLIFRQSSEDTALMCYHDEVYKTAMTLGMPEADDIDVFEFAFKKLANDHMRNIRHLAIQSHNKDLIRYMYHSPNGVGITCEYLKSGDVSKQVAAANLPGFWVAEKRIEKQVALFWALQDRLYGAGKVAEAAANSIHCLSKAWAEQSELPHPFLIGDPSKIDAPNVVDTLINLLIQPIRPSLVFQLRALEACCRSKQVLEHIYNQGGVEHNVLGKELQDMIAGSENAQLSSRPKKLCKKLHSVIMQRSSARQPAKISAANMLHALLCFNGELEGVAKEKMREIVRDHIQPAEFMPRTEEGKGPYLWSHERDMLDRLRNSLGLPKYDWHNVRVLRPDGTDETPPPLLERTFARQASFPLSGSQECVA